MKLNRTSYALVVALAGTLAVVGCKKKEEEAMPAPAVTEAPVPAPMTEVEAPPPMVSTTSITVGNVAADDKSVAAMGTFAPSDKIIVSVKTDAATPSGAAITAKLTYQDGQTAGEQTANVMADGGGTTNIEFSNANPWPAGTYKVDVTVNGQPVGMTQQIEVK